MARKMQARRHVDALGEFEAIRFIMRKWSAAPFFLAQSRTRPAFGCGARGKTRCLQHTPQSTPTVRIYQNIYTQGTPPKRWPNQNCINAARFRCRFFRLPLFFVARVNSTRRGTGLCACGALVANYYVPCAFF
jgi:hypothetical protein